MKIDGLSLNDLKYFFDTVESYSLTAAADKNYVTRPAISLALQRLESWSGLKLLTHQRKTFALTKDGESFYRQMRAAFGVFKSSVESGPLRTGGSLKVGCSVSLFDQFLLPAFKDLGKGITPLLKTGTSTQLKSFLEEGQINLAIYVDDSESFSYETAEIFSGQFVLASHSGKMSSIVVTTELRPEVAALRKILLKKNVVKQIQVESWTLAAKMALSLEGACLVPDYLLESKLKKIALPGFKERYRVCLAHERKEKLSFSEIEMLERILAFEAP